MTIQDKIKQKLADELAPVHLEVMNESHQHNVPPNSETHFKVICVSSQFEGLTRVKRHQQVYALLADEMEQGVHALALHLFEPQQWRESASAPESPQCLGGSKGSP